MHFQTYNILFESNVGRDIFHNSDVSIRITHDTRNAIEIRTSHLISGPPNLTLNTNGLKFIHHKLLVSLCFRHFSNGHREDLDQSQLTLKVDLFIF